jgi:hypothetical protein
MERSVQSYRKLGVALLAATTIVGMTIRAILAQSNPPASAGGGPDAERPPDAAGARAGWIEPMIVIPARDITTQRTIMGCLRSLGAGDTTSLRENAVVQQSKIASTSALHASSTCIVKTFRSEGDSGNAA